MTDIILRSVSLTSISGESKVKLFSIDKIEVQTVRKYRDVGSHFSFYVLLIENKVVRQSHKHRKIKMKKHFILSMLLALAVGGG